MAKYGLNRVTLIGNLGKDPDLKYTDQGIPWANLWMACTESYRDKNGTNVDRTEWVSVNIWRGQAEVASKYCRKGSTVCIEGRLSSRTYTTDTGETRRITEVEGRKLILLDSRPASANPPQTAVPVSETPPVGQTNTPPATSVQQPVAEDQKSNSQDDLDDLPF